MKKQIEQLAEELKERPRTVFPQTRIDVVLFQMLQDKKEQRHLTWEGAVTEMGIDWLKKK